MALPAATAWLLAMMSWRHALGVVGSLGLVTASCILLFLRRSLDAADAGVPQVADEAAPRTGKAPRLGVGFAMLLAIGVPDSATRMGFLAFLPSCWGERRVNADHWPGPHLRLCGRGRRQTACGLLGAASAPPDRHLDGTGNRGRHHGTSVPLAAALVCLTVIGIALKGTLLVRTGPCRNWFPPEAGARIRPVVDGHDRRWRDRRGDDGGLSRTASPRRTTTPVVAVRLTTLPLLAWLWLLASGG